MPTNDELQIKNYEVNVLFEFKVEKPKEFSFWVSVHGADSGKVLS